MKRALCILSIIFIVSSFAWGQIKIGIGLSGGVNVVGEPTADASLTVALSKIRLYSEVGATFTFEPELLHAFLHLDWLMVKESLFGGLYFSTGPGVYTAFPAPFKLGMRIPMFIRLLFRESPLELFISVSPTIVFLGGPGVTLPGFDVPVSLGFRFWI